MVSWKFRIKIPCKRIWFQAVFPQLTTWNFRSNEKEKETLHATERTWVSSDKLLCNLIILKAQFYLLTVKLNALPLDNTRWCSLQFCICLQSYSSIYIIWQKFFAQVQIKRNTTNQYEGEHVLLQKGKSMHFYFTLLCSVILPHIL